MLQSLKTSLGRPKLDTWCIMESMGPGLSWATCNGSVTPDALLGIHDDDDVGAIWLPLSGGLLCHVAMVVALVATGFIGGRGLIGGGEIGLCCSYDCCCCCGGWRVVQSIPITGAPTVSGSSSSSLCYWLTSPSR